MVMGAQPCADTKNHWIVYFKMAGFMLCELYLNLKKIAVCLLRLKLEAATFNGCTGVTQASHPKGGVVKSPLNRLEKNKSYSISKGHPRD